MRIRRSLTGRAEDQPRTPSQKASTKTVELNRPWKPYSASVIPVSSAGGIQAGACAAIRAWSMTAGAKMPATIRIWAGPTGARLRKSDRVPARRYALLKAKGYLPVVYGWEALTVFKHRRMGTVRHSIDMI